MPSPIDPDHSGSALTEALAAFAARVSGCLVALDFDGTLAPIVDDPSQSRAVAGAFGALSRLAGAGAQIAVVTGRDALTALELSRFAEIPGLIVSGLHGAEVWHDGSLQTRDEPAGIDVLRRELPPLLDQVDPDSWLEDKRLSLVVHTRRSADPLTVLEQLRGPVTELAEANGLQVLDGKFVLEIRIPGLSKADAVSRLLTPQTTAALFAGDDHGDLPAFEAIHSWSRRTGNPAVAIAVGEVAEVRQAADVRLPAPAALADLLAALL